MVMCGDFSAMSSVWDQQDNNPQGKALEEALRFQNHPPLHHRRMQMNQMLKDDTSQKGTEQNQRLNT